MGFRSSSSIVSLGGLDHLEQWFGSVSSPWVPEVGRRSDSDELVLVFNYRQSGETDRPYLNSVRQRVGLINNSEDQRASLMDFNWDADQKVSLVSDLIEGEPFLQYFSRVDTVAEFDSLQVLVDLVEHLKRLSIVTRVLSCLELEDFFITRRDGARLEASPVLCFAVIRDEEPKSDFQIARKWISLLAGLFGAMKSGWKREPGSINPSDVKPFRGLLKELSSGAEKPLFERLTDVENLLKKELSGIRSKGAKCRLVGAAHVPFGVVGNSILSRFSATWSSGGDWEVSNCRRSLFSSFVFEEEQPDSGDRRMLYLLPPEGWFAESLIQPVNRKMAHPYLRAHHNGIRTRSVFCEEGYTLLVGGDVARGLPLPILFAIRRGIEPREVLSIAEKVSRALAQFEGAELELILSSPWQIELHPESILEEEDWARLLEQNVCQWPTWEVKIRVELPCEHFLVNKRHCSWKSIFDSQKDQFFPTLFGWMLDWQRFNWAIRSGLQEREPISWDESVRLLLDLSPQGQDMESLDFSGRTRMLEALARALNCLA